MVNSGGGGRPRWAARLLALLLVVVWSAGPGAAPGGALDLGFWMGEYEAEAYELTGLFENQEPKVSWQEALERLEADFALPAVLPAVDLEEGEDGLVWQFSWMDPLGVGPVRGEAFATVDATTGELHSFHSFWPAPLPPRAGEEMLTRDQARQRAAGLIEQLYPALWTELLPWNTGFEWGPSPEENPQGYQFTWVQAVAGIPFPQNLITVGIHPVTGRITHLDRIWLGQPQYTTATPALTPAEALERLRELGAELAYVPIRPAVP